MEHHQEKYAIYGTIGSRLREERVRMALNQKDFGGLVGASLQTQGRYEKGEQLPKLDYLIDLQSHGVDISYIVTGRRSVSDLAHEDRWLLDQFHSLSVRERAGIMQMLSTLADTRSGGTIHKGVPNLQNVHDNDRTWKGHED